MTDPEGDSEVARLLLLGPAREAAGRRDDVIDGDSVDVVLKEAAARYGPDFERVLEVSQVWVNGDAANAKTRVGPHDEVAVVPPVSGG
ncbi:MAG TPA: MoaD/ThiS family protein [Acidimicrobiales bacterium]|nr:MoaD/ThiS family protein [Acidimicrobiales bacterium]